MKVRLCGTAEVGEGEMIQAIVSGKPAFAVYQVEGEYFVTDDTCTHGKASLADEGDLEGHCITCTWHDGKFDIRTGECLAAPCTVPIKAYPVKIEEDAVWIDLE
jgi:nitrite reductase/ring-hydroxylating ferredoxin subunit